MTRWWCFSVTKSGPTLWDHMDCSGPGFPVLHCLLESAQTQVHWVGDSRTSHLLSSPSPPAFNLSQHQGLFQWVGYLNQMAKVLELLHQSFQWIFRVDFLQDWLVWFPCSPGERVAISQESSPAPQLKTISSFSLSLLYSPTLTFLCVYWENYSFDYTDLCQQGDVSAF